MQTDIALTESGFKSGHGWRTTTNQIRTNPPTHNIATNHKNRTVTKYEMNELFYLALPYMTNSLPIFLRRDTEDGDLTLT